MLSFASAKVLASLNILYSGQVTEGDIRYVDEIYTRKPYNIIVQMMLL